MKTYTSADPDALKRLHAQHYSAMGIQAPAKHNADLGKPWLQPVLSAQIKQRIAALGPEKLTAPIDLSTLKYMISTLSDTAPGLDGVQNSSLKVLLRTSVGDALEARTLLLKMILGLLNTILESAELPSVLATGEILSFYKKGNPETLKSYRPITLLASQHFQNC